MRVDFSNAVGFDDSADTTQREDIRSFGFSSIEEAQIFTDSDGNEEVTQIENMCRMASLTLNDINRGMASRSRK